MLGLLAAAAQAQVTLVLKTGQTLVVEKARISDGGVMVLVDKSMKKVPYSDLTDACIAELGATKLAAEAAKPKEPPVQVVHTEQRQPQVEGGVAVKPVGKEKIFKKIDPADAALMRKLQSDLEETCIACEKDIRSKFNDPAQQQQAIDALQVSKTLVGNMIGSLRKGLTQVVVESLVQAQFGLIQIERRTQADGSVGMGFEKSLFGRMHAVFGLELGADGIVKAWSCEFRHVGR